MRFQSMVGVAALGMVCGSNMTRDAHPQHTVPIEFPKDLIGGAKDRHICRLIVEIAPDGVPRSIQHEDCAAEIATAVDDGINQWRWGTFDGRGIAPVTVGIQEPKEKFASTAPPVEGDWNEYRFKKWVDPPFMMVPPMKWGARTTTCLVHVGVASNGVPVSTAVSNCGITIQVELATALLKTRWPAHEHAGSLVWLKTTFKAPYTVGKE